MITLTFYVQQNLQALSMICNGFPNVCIFLSEFIFIVKLMRLLGLYLVIYVLYL